MWTLLAPFSRHYDNFDDSLLPDFADYLGTSVRNSFEVNGPTENCVNFVVFDDQIIEPTEQFVVTVSNTVSVIGGQAAINIIDNDGK